MKGRKEASTIVRYLIGNGETARLWLDPWQHHGRLKEDFPATFTNSSELHLNAKVSSLIHNGKWLITDNLRRTLPETVRIIEETKIMGGEDELVWTAGRTGDYERDL